MRMEILPYQRIRNLRIDNDLTQTQIANMLYIGQRTYSNYEIGNCHYPLDVVKKLAVFYDTSIDYLLELTDDPRPYARKTQRG